MGTHNEQQIKGMISSNSSTNNLSSPQFVVVRGHNILGLTKRLLTAAESLIRGRSQMTSSKFLDF